MRTSTVLADAAGLGPHDHVCWAFDEDDVLRAQVLAFLADGLACGQRVRYVGSDAETVALLRSMAREGDHGEGSWSAGEVSDTYRTGEIVDPEKQVQAYAAATADAERAGYTGLRVAADATPLVRTSEQREAFGRYEHLIDRYMTGRRFAALCAYDLREVGADAVEEIACLHPAVNDGATAFRLFAPAGAGADVSVAGEIDAAVDETFREALHRADPSPVGPSFVVDGRDLTFIDHRGLMALSAHARRHDTTALLRTRIPVAARLIEVLDLESIRVEEPR